VDGGNPSADYNDPEHPNMTGMAFPPSMGTIRNDMGAYGGPGVFGWQNEIRLPRIPDPVRKKRPVVSRLYPNPSTA
jgi:hypothetical protein